MARGRNDGRRTTTQENEDTADGLSIDALKPFRRREGSIDRLDGLVVHLAPEGFLGPTVEQAEPVLGRLDRLVFSQSVAQNPWAQNSWLEPVLIEIDSISDGVKKLRSMQRNWAVFPTRSARRSLLMEDGLPKIKKHTFSPGELVPSSPMGAFTLLDDRTILASKNCTSPFPGGELKLIESPEPPSRAYLKLQEAFLRMGRWPAPNERCFDAGACPGGWTWAALQHGASVLAVDRAPLDERVCRLTGVETRLGDAFRVSPDREGPFDWVFSDVAAAPERTLEFVELWRASGKAKRIIVTLKFKGSEHREIVKKYLEIPNGRLFHGCYNKHELTFCWVRPED